MSEGEVGKGDPVRARLTVFQRPGELNVRTGTNILAMSRQSAGLQQGEGRGCLSVEAVWGKRSRHPSRIIRVRGLVV